MHDEIFNCMNARLLVFTLRTHEQLGINNNNICCAGIKIWADSLNLVCLINKLYESAVVEETTYYCSMVYRVFDYLERLRGVEK